MSCYLLAHSNTELYIYYTTKKSGTPRDLWPQTAASKKKSQPPLENYISTVEKLITQGSTNYLEREGIVTKFYSY